MALKVEEHKVRGVEIVSKEYAARHKAILAAKLLPLIPVLVKNLAEIKEVIGKGKAVIDEELGGILPDSEENDKDVVSWFMALPFDKLPLEPLSALMAEIVDTFSEKQYLTLIDAAIGNTTVNNVSASEMFSDGYEGKNYFNEDFPLLFIVAWHGLRVNDFFGLGAIGKHL